MRQPGRHLILFLGLALLVPTLAARDVAPAAHSVFHVALGTASTQPVSGRLLLFATDARTAMAEAKDGKVDEADANPFHATQTSLAAREVGRLAPGQEVETIAAAAETLVRGAAPEGADVQIAWSGAAPGLVRPDAPAIRLGLEAFEKALGRRPLLTRTGGTLPIMPALAAKGIDTILTGFGLPESNVHSPNERFLVDYFAQGIASAAELYTALGALPR